MSINRHNNLGRDRLWDLKVCPRLWEFMSLVLHNIHVVVWSCMKDAILHNVLKMYFQRTSFVD